MEIEVVATDKFDCEACGTETEFEGYYNHTTRKLCPFCAVEEVIEIVNYGGNKPKKKDALTEIVKEKLKQIKEKKDA